MSDVINCVPDPLPPFTAAESANYRLREITMEIADMSGQEDCPESLDTPAENDLRASEIRIAAFCNQPATEC